MIAKIAKLQEALVDKHLPTIKEQVQAKIDALEGEMSELPVCLETDEERAMLFNQIIRKIRTDLESRIKGESSDADLTVSPVVAKMVQFFKEKLLSKNPKWLEKAMIDEVSRRQATKQGYTVDNLIGPHSDIFIALIKEKIIEEGLLKECAYSLVGDVREHLQKVVQHVIQRYAHINGILPAALNGKAEDCIDNLGVQARGDCERLCLAQEETSTTYDLYNKQMSQFVASLSDESTIELAGEKSFCNMLPEEFVLLRKDAVQSPQKRAVLEICVSVHTYTKLMIEGFVEMSAKLVKFSLVGQLVEKLEEVWRKESGRTTLQKLFAEEESVAQKREDLSKKMKVLSDFKVELRGLLPAVLQMQNRKQILSKKAKAEEGNSSSAKETDNKPQPPPPPLRAVAKP